jgi:hypothetical protein
LKHFLRTGLFFEPTMRTIEKTTKATSATARRKTKLVSRDRITSERVIKEYWVRVTFMVPTEYAAILGTPGRCADRGSACVWEDAEQVRIDQWGSPYKLNGVRHPAKKNLLEAILRMDLDTPLTYAIPCDEWPRIKTVCKALEISTCDYLLASAEYNYQLSKARSEAAAMA